MKSFFLFIIEDLKSDWKTLKQIFSGEAKLQVSPKELIKADWGAFWKKNYPWVLFAIALYFCGYWMATQHAGHSR